MSDTIKISFVEEEVKFDEMTKRERAIYDTGYSKGYDKGRHNTVIVIVFIIFMLVGGIMSHF